MSGSELYEIFKRGMGERKLRMLVLLCKINVFLMVLVMGLSIVFGTSSMICAVFQK